MIKYLTTALIALALLTATASVSAAPISWDFTSGILQPLQSAVNAVVRGFSFQATSQTATSSFPIASSTTFCLGTDCRTAWPTGGAGGTVYLATTSPWTTNEWVTVSSNGTVRSFNGTTTIRNSLSATSPLSYNSATGVFSVATGFAIASTSGLTNLYSFYDTPSTRITDGNALTWSGNTLNFDGGNTPGGELGGTWASPTINDGLAVSNFNLTTPTLTSFFSAACASGEAVQDISDTGTFTCIAVGSGGGGGGSGAGFATTTDGVQVTFTSPNNPVYFGGSASTTAEIIIDYRTAEIKIATSSRFATSTVTNTNEAQSVRFGSATSSLEWDFRTVGQAIVRGINAVTDIVFNTAVRLASTLKDGTGSAGSNGNVLTSTGTGVAWVATSSLGISGGSGGSGTIYLASSSPSWVNSQLTYITGAGTIAGTSSPTVAGLNVTGTTSLMGYIRCGTTMPPNLEPLVQNLFDCWSADADGAYATLGNTSSGGNAYAAWLLNNNITRSDGANYAGNLLYSSTYNNTAFGTFAVVPNAYSMENTMGPLLFMSATTSNSFMAWATNGGDSANERMRLTALGNLGIGTTSPSARLTVSGDMRLTGRFADSASSTGSVGSVLTATANGTQWVATSSLGISGGGGSGTIYLASTTPWTENEWIVVSGNGTVRSFNGTTTVRNSLFASSPLSYNNSTGAFSVASGFTVPSSTLITSASSFFASPSSLCVSITGSASLCDGNDETGGGGGGSGGGWSTTTDVVGSGAAQTVNYVTTDVMFGGSASTTSEFLFDKDGAQLILASTTNTTATATIQSGNDANAVRIMSNAPETTGGIEWDFRTLEKAIVRGVGAVKNIIFVSSNGSTTMSISVATTTVRHSSGLAGFVQDVLARVTVGIDNVIGYYRSGRLFGSLTINGLFWQEGWNQVDCSTFVGATQISADGLTGCDGFAFYEDGTATLTSTAGQGFVYGRLSTSAINDGAGVFLNAPTGGFLIFATSTPIFEAVARINTVQNQGTSTQTYIGFTNIASAGTTFETAPTAGCYFTASTTIPNWWAICRTSLGAVTGVNTGIASTTVITGDGVPYRFMIESDTTGARFYIQSSEAANLDQVAYITTNVPSTTVMNAGVHFGRISGVTAVGVDIYDMNIGWRKMLSRF